jgi:GMP synthase (glutamine-hydrolysing)
MILVLTHSAEDRLGTLEHFLSIAGERTSVVLPGDDAGLPSGLDDVDALISLGADDCLDEDGWHPSFTHEMGLIRAAASREIPILGICLGAQVITWAMGGEVMRHGSPEKGWQTLSLTTEGRHDPLLRWLPGCIEAFSWSHASCILPPGARLLMGGSPNPNQAFHCGSAWGVQFHIEVNHDLIERWFPGDPDLPRMRNTLESYRTLHDAQVYTIYRNFLSIVAGRRRLALSG